MKKYENGQAIVLIIIVLVGLIAIAALMIDGGNAYSNRRNAQTAADAGALAGAYEYCVKGNDPTNVITEYVEVQNHAKLDTSNGTPGWHIDSTSGDIVVNTYFEQNNFFAKIFGQKTTTVRAEASAGCFGVGFAGGLLPIAWTCRPPLPGMDTIGGDECAMYGIPYDTFELIKNEVNTNPSLSFTAASTNLDDGTLLDTGTPGNYASYLDDTDGSAGEAKMIYLIADSLKVDGMLEDVCEELSPSGTVNCDFDNDGILDIDGGAGRGWILMDGDDNQGASILFKIINGELELSTQTPRWFAGLTGGKASAFGVIRDVRVGDYALIPIFDAVCDTDDPVNDLTNCPLYYGSGETVIYANGTADYLYYRVNGFAVFYISCVTKNSADFCPGKNRALGYNVIDPNTATVEGYFIENYIPENVGIGTNSLDLGLYILSLTD